MLAPVIRSAVVDLWDDRKIPIGAKWQDVIQGALASARIAVLLVSQNFLASRFIAENELPPLLRAAENEGVTIFWLCLSSCLFEQTEIASYQAAHDVSRPLDRLSKSQRQAVLSAICAKLVETAKTPISHVIKPPTEASDDSSVPSPRILIAEDDRDIVELIRYKLESESFRVDCAYDGATALRKVREQRPDLLLLDLMLPKLYGLDILKELRRDPAFTSLQILILTHRGEEADVVAALELGADGYMTKPCSPRELTARVRGLLRRSRELRGGIN